MHYSTQNGSHRTRSQNPANKGVPINNTSDYKDKWEARNQYEGSRLYLGRFEHTQEAALAYDVASRHLYGAFAGCNLPQKLMTVSICEMTLARLARRREE